MYVICFYWQGDRWKTKKGSSKDTSYYKHLGRVGEVNSALVSRYVNNLYRGVKKFASRDFQFICFTNEDLKGLDAGVETRSFEMPVNAGVLPRLFMFSKQAGLFGHQVLCLDLDVVIVGSLKTFMDYEGVFCARTKFKRNQTHKLDGDIMSFQASRKTERLFWDPFIEDPAGAVELTQGRERYWMRHVAGDIADKWGNNGTKLLSYKNHVRRENKLPGKASIVSCHGYPRPHQIKEQWIKQYWR